MNGSIVAHYIWRVFLQIRLIDSLAIPESERPALHETIKKLKMIFIHKNMI